MKNEWLFRLLVFKAAAFLSIGLITDGMWGVAFVTSFVMSILYADYLTNCRKIV